MTKLDLAEMLALCSVWAEALGYFKLNIDCAAMARCVAYDVHSEGQDQEVQDNEPS